MRLTVGRIILLGLTITGLLFGSGCKDTNLQKVRRDVIKFNVQYNAGQFQEMYSDAAPKFRGAISEQDFLSKMEALRQQYGEIKESKLIGFEEMSWLHRRFRNLKSPRFIGYNSRCDNGWMQEFFAWDVRADEAKLIWFESNIVAFNNSQPK